MSSILNKIKESLKPKKDWEAESEKHRLLAQSWEFKFNKLQRQLKAVIEEASN